MKIATIIGARPQFIKSAIVSQAIEAHNKTSGYPNLEEYLVHTGQHYDPNMNDIFFQSLSIKTPDLQLHNGGLTNPAKMLSGMLTGIEKALHETRPDGVLVYGDTYSTLAGALAASLSHIPLFHVEAGLRSFNKQMPEEVNRIVTDHLSAKLFCPSRLAIQNLANEGIAKGVFYTGDVMYDAALTFGKIAAQNSKILESLGIQSKEFHLCTVHRAENTDNPDRIEKILIALIEIAKPQKPVILPLHPRTKRKLIQYNLKTLTEKNPSLRLIDPVDYLDMLMLEKNAATILTDSGGIQKEAYFFRTPCITLREETEWNETVAAGWNQLAGTNKILECLEKSPEKSEIDDYGNGKAADKIVKEIVNG